MSIFGEAVRRGAPKPRAAPEPAPAQQEFVSPPAPGDSELRRRRDALAARVTELHWDLGGLAYEMAIRDHFRLDVLMRRAAVLQEQDAELAEVERLLALEESASAGSCAECGAPHSRGAVFCWQCGAGLMAVGTPGAHPARADRAAHADTAVMDALLTGERGAQAHPDAPGRGLRDQSSGG